MSTVSGIFLKTAEEIELMRKANFIVAKVLGQLRETIKPGVTTFQLDKISEQTCHDLGGVPAFKGYYGYPASLCASINEEVVHGIPSRKRVLREGDIVSLDFGAIYQGFYGDAAITVPVGTVSERTRELLKITEEALQKGIEQAQVGKRVADISKAVQTYVETAGFSVVRQYVGHGVGAHLHEEPEVPNYVDGLGKTSPRLKKGMVIAIEPMVNMGTHKVRILEDQWTVVTQDRKPSAHFEHSVAITENGPQILSLRDAAIGDVVDC